MRKAILFLLFFVCCFVSGNAQVKIETQHKLYITIIVFLCLAISLCIYYIFNKNIELRIAKHKVKNLTRVKSDFYSEVSHELRTPLYAVIELSSIMLKENINEKHREYLESLNFSGNHLLSLTNNILELNKIESSQHVKLEKLTFSLKDTVVNIIDSLEYALNDSSNKIHLEYDERIPDKIIGDSLKLSQVLINLISNAVKFTNKGDINILIERLNESQKEIMLFFKISDTGLGISENKQKLIFEDYYQEQYKSQNSYKGTGLGLSIVKRLLGIMGSEINVESKIGKGTSFFFLLNFNKIKKSKIKPLHINKYDEVLRGLNILIVDDNKINQMVTKKVLKQLDLKSETVDNGEKAISMVKDKKFDCILMDLHMPGLDGYQTTEAIRTFNKDIPIIALTASSKHEVEKKIKKSGIDSFVLKPFVTDSFKEVLAKTIEKK